MAFRQPRLIKRQYPWISKNLVDGYSISGEKEFITSIKILDSDDDASRRNQAKSCMHWKYNHYPLPAVRRWFSGTTEWYLETGWTEDYGSDPFQKVVAIAENSLASHPTDWDKVTQKVTGQLKNDFNLINFLLELDDFKTLFERWQGVSQFWLRWSFGISPMIEDAKAVAKQLYNQATRLNGLAEKLERGFRAGTKKGPMKFTYVYDTGSQGELEWTISGTITLRWTCFVQGFFHGSLVSRFLDAIGFYPTFSTAWNAVPFSFIIDYFIPIGDALASQESSWSEMSAGLSMACRSAKVDFTTEVRLKDLSVKPAGTSWDIRYETPLLAYGNGTYYVRIPDYNAVLDGIDFNAGITGTPGGKQIANLQALAFENLKKTKRPPSMKKWIAPGSYKLGKGFRFHV